MGHRVNGSFGSSFTSGSPGRRVIILTEFLPVFEKMLKMQNVHLKCWNDKSHCQVAVVGLKSLDVNPYAMNFNFYLWLLKILWPENTGTSSHISRHLEFIIEQGYRVNWVGRVAGFPGHWIAGSQNVTQFHLWFAGNECLCLHGSSPAGYRGDAKGEKAEWTTGKARKWED